MKAQILYVFTALAALTLASGCATDQTGRKLDKKLSQQQTPATRKELRQEVTQWIDQSKSLTDEEKQKIKTVRTQAMSRDEALSERSLKLRAVLIEKVLSENYDPVETGVIQEDLKSVENERLSVLFSAIRQTNVILGRWASKNQRESEQFYDDMMREIGPPGFFF